jgi:hypothetical protein
VQKNPPLLSEGRFFYFAAPQDFNTESTEQTLVVRAAELKRESGLSQLSAAGFPFAFPDPKRPQDLGTCRVVAKRRSVKHSATHSASLRPSHVLPSDAAVFGSSGDTTDPEPRKEIRPLT